MTTHGPAAMSPEERAELKRLAEAAGSCPWDVWSSLYKGMAAAVVHDAEPLETIAEVRTYPKAVFIAAANPAAILALLARIDALEDEKVEAQQALAVCRQSLVEQAAARRDPTMPLLTPEVLETLKGDAEANYACAETRKERIAAHGLSLLCDWQERAASLLQGQSK